MILKQPIKTVEGEEFFKCLDCNDVKGASEYYVSKSKLYKKTGLPIRFSYCKDCQNERSKKRHSLNLKESQNRHRLARYGISSDDFDRMYEKQKKVCRICNQRRMYQRKNGTLLSLHIDHNHSTGRVRGLLCHNCNLGLGYFNESILDMLRAIYYLLRDRFITLVSLK